MGIFDGSVGLGTIALLVLCLAIALGFEFVNGFHDTANAVATVIYTKTLKPGVAVVWSGFCNFCGVYFGTIIGGAAVAFGIVHLLPLDLLLHIGRASGLYMILSLLVAAVIWNLITWYFGLPASSSHSLIGAILGVGLVSSFLGGHPGSGVNWSQAEKAGLALLLSPLVGFCGAGLLMLLSKATIKAPVLYDEPHGETPPPPAVRALLCLTCTLVSFFHGSNDGQKGVGLIMLILFGILPTQFAINEGLHGDKLQSTVASVQSIEKIVAHVPGASADSSLSDKLARIEKTLSSYPKLSQVPKDERNALRADVMTADAALDKLAKSETSGLSDTDKKSLKSNRGKMIEVTDFVVPWIPFAVAFALGVGTTVGWKRIVVTVGEKIGKTHLSYAQGASAELMAAVTIFLADRLGLPVSTTHVLSSGVAGTMAANHSGLQVATVRNIAAAWVLTIPATALLAGGLFAMTSAGAIRQQEAIAPIPVHAVAHAAPVQLTQTQVTQARQ